jgi:sugar/nucleoside kinase (ribokinase family)
MDESGKTTGGRAGDSPRMIGVGGVFIDDIVLASGETRMASLGGAAVHALMGAAIWGERAGIVAPIGRGFPDSLMGILEENLDVRGLRRIGIEQMRAWQIIEEDGRRRELYRVAETRPFIEGLSPEDLPDGYDRGAAFYLLLGFDGVRRWRAKVNGFVLWEPLQQVMRPGGLDSFRAVLRECPVDLVSPNLLEAQAIYGALLPEELVDAMIRDGAAAVALRLGAEGSIVADATTGGPVRVKAVPVARVVDAIGAGNTYCGGLLAGIVQGRGLRAAAAQGAVSASFCIETWGVVRPREVDPLERDRRLAEVG